MVVENIVSTFEAVIGRNYEIFLLNNCKTRNKKQKLLYPPLLPTELSNKVGVFYASFNLPMVYFKDFVRILRISVLSVDCGESSDLG